MTLERRVRQLHKIFGLLVALQLFMWMASGLYMTAVPIETVRGNHLIQPVLEPALTPVEISPNTLIAQYPDSKEIGLIVRNGLPVYQIISGEEEIWISADTGELITQLDGQQATEIARLRYTGDADISSTVYIDDITLAPEARGRTLPLWQVNFDDWQQTSFYVSAMSAEVVAVRSDIWRWFDFLWMLHIMDYEDREDMNNPLVILFASLGLLLTTSGIIMVWSLLKRRGLGTYLR